MFETKTPLAEMSLGELQATRIIWLDQITPLAVQICQVVLNHVVQMVERGYQTWKLDNQYPFTIEVIKVDCTYNTDAGSYQTTYNVQIKSLKEPVLNIGLVFLGDDFKEIANLKSHNFTRPTAEKLDWTWGLQEVIDLYQDQERRQIAEQKEKERKDLLALLLTGRLQ